MKFKYLLDTNILSEPLVADPDTEVLDKIKCHHQELATAAPVWNELVFGYLGLPESKKRRRIAQYLNEVVAVTMPILPYDAAAAAWHGEERARLAALGTMAPLVDGQIAAISKVNNLVLVTRNLRDYQHFQELRLEDWFGNGS